MKTKIFAITTILIFLSFVGCGKIKETVEKKVDETATKEVEKQTQEVSKQIQQADSLMKSAGEEIDKEAKIKEALDEEKILADENGQWAIVADASSSYAGEKADKKASWSPNQMTGKPNVESYGDHGEAWAPKDPNKGIEWVKVTFPKSVNATDVRIRQTYGPGAIIKVELIDDKGSSHTVWEGVDKTKYEPDKIKYFVASFDKTAYKTKVVKITLATNSVPGWNEIDAVQLVGTK
jgi:hypothetical protein